MCWVIQIREKDTRKCLDIGNSINHIQDVINTLHK